MAQVLTADNVYGTKVNNKWTSYFPAVFAIGGGS